MNTHSAPFTILKLLALATLLLMSTQARAELNAYMEVTGETQGTMLGDVTQAGREGQFRIDEMHHLIRAGDPSTAHESLIVATPMSKSFPLLLKALDTRELLQVTIKFWRPSPTGQEDNYYTFVLRDAQLVVAEPIMHDNKIPENMQLQIRARLRFDYASIEHTYEPEEQILELQNQ